MPAMNYFDSNRTNTVIFNFSWTAYTRHLVAVPLKRTNSLNCRINVGIVTLPVFKTKGPKVQNFMFLLFVHVIAMNYFDSNRTNTVIFNFSWTAYTRHLVAVPFTSFGNFEMILNYLLSSFWLILKQQWTIEENSMLSNSSHLEWRAGLSDTFLKGTHPRTIPARFGLIRFRGFKMCLTAPPSIQDGCCY
jgi:hypothetical protein